MQLSRLPSAPPNLLAEPLGILSQENKSNMPGKKAILSSGYLLPKSANCLEVSLALPHPALAVPHPALALPHPALAVPWDLPGLCDIPPLAQDSQDGPG